MTFYKYPARSLADHGCRLVKDDDFYVDSDLERSVVFSPLVDISRGHMLVGPTQNRLMLLHALLMSSDMEIHGVPANGSPLEDQDVIDLATGLMENFGYESLVAPMGKSPTAQTSDQKAACQAIAARVGHVWSAIAGLAYSHGDRFREAAESGKAYLIRKVTQGVGILDQVSTQPLMWETAIRTGPNPIMGWRMPAQAMVRMIEVALQFPEIVALPRPEPEPEPARAAGEWSRQRS